MARPRTVSGQDQVPLRVADFIRRIAQLREALLAAKAALENRPNDKRAAEALKTIASALDDKRGSQ